MNEIDTGVSKLLRAMQNAMDWKIEEDGEDWSDDEEAWSEFFQDLSESVACGYAGNISTAIIDEVVAKSFEEPKVRETWREDILKEAQLIQERWALEDDDAT